MTDMHQVIYEFLRTIQYGRRDGDISLLFQPGAVANTIPTLSSVLNDRELLNLVQSPEFLNVLTNQRVLDNVTNPNFFLNLMIHNLFIEADKRAPLTISYLPNEMLRNSVSDYSFTHLLSILQSLDPAHSQQALQVLSNDTLYKISQNPQVQKLITDTPQFSFLCNPILSGYVQLDSFWKSVGEPASIMPEYPAQPKNLCEQTATRTAMKIVAIVLKSINEAADFNGFEIEVNLPLMLRSLHVKNAPPQMSMSSGIFPPTLPANAFNQELFKNIKTSPQAFGEFVPGQVPASLMFNNTKREMP